LADETSGSSVEGAGTSTRWRCARFSFILAARAASADGCFGGALTNSTIDGQLAEELAELHDGSISLFVTLPVFRGLLISDQRAAALARFEGLVGEHLAHLDGILGDVIVRRDRSDGDLTRSLFRSLGVVRARPASPSRDQEILGVVEQAQLFLMGSCSFALRFARQARLERSVHVLEDSLARIGSLAMQFMSPNDGAHSVDAWSDAVA
jgi:hypothetical protein